jgi:hypothetical protein
VPDPAIRHAPRCSSYSSLKPTTLERSIALETRSPIAPAPNAQSRAAGERIAEKSPAKPGGNGSPRTGPYAEEARRALRVVSWRGEGVSVQPCVIGRTDAPVNV